MLNDPLFASLGDSKITRIAAEMMSEINLGELIGNIMQPSANNDTNSEEAPNLNNFLNPNALLDFFDKTQHKMTEKLEKENLSVEETEKEAKEMISKLSTNPMLSSILGNLGGNGNNDGSTNGNPAQMLSELMEEVKSMENSSDDPGKIAFKLMNKIMKKSPKTTSSTENEMNIESLSNEIEEMWK
jgi:hypothetical protein